MASQIDPRLDEIEANYERVAAEIAEPDVASDPDRLRALGRRFAELEDVVVPYREYRAARTQALEARELARGETEPEMATFLGKSRAAADAGHTVPAREFLQSLGEIAKPLSISFRRG